jgi:hypothetical protein
MSERSMNYNVKNIIKQNQQKNTKFVHDILTK